jgi:hypothetical protein
MGPMNPDAPQFADWVHLLRYWLAMHHVPDSGKIRIEVIFPDQRSQFHAFASLRQELTPQTMAFAGVSHDMSPDQLEYEGVKISFTNPERWDKRR